MSNVEPLKAAGAKKRPGEITLQRMRIFWAVAHNETMTKASKQLGLSQPSLSQQIASLEAAVGTPLFERRSNQMILTEAGNFLLRKAEQVLRGMQELEDGLAEFSDGVRVTVRVAGLSSMLRLVLPRALANTQNHYPDVEYDIHDCAPSDVLEMLYGRRANIGLVNSSSIARAGSGFMELPLLEDPYVLAVPETVSLEDIADLKQLDLPQQEIMARSIRFAFGTTHTQRVQEWYEKALPNNQQVATTRSYEDALALVRAGVGICLAPLLACMMDGAPSHGVRLYRAPFQPRKMVALVPTQYRHTQPYASFLEALQESGQNLELPPLRVTPPFLRDPRDKTDVPHAAAGA